MASTLSKTTRTPWKASTTAPPRHLHRTTRAIGNTLPQNRIFKYQKEARNPGMPLDLDWLYSTRINKSAVERRAATLVTRRTVKTRVAGGLAPASDDL